MSEPLDLLAEVERLRAKLARRDADVIAGAEVNAARLMELHAELARRDAKDGKPDA